MATTTVEHSSVLRLADQFEARGIEVHRIGVDENGVITIRTWSEDQKVLISVSDNGHGIAEEHMKQLFTPFFTTKPVGEGTGLGLSISHGLVEEHRGEIAVASEVGQGTTFTISLPAS